MSIGSPSQGGDTPPPEEEFIPPGGVTAPEHFEYGYAAHLINNALGEVFMCEISANTKAKLLKYINHLLTKYNDDLELPEFTSWQFFLRALKALARLEDWEGIRRLHNENKDSLPKLKSF